MTIFIVAYILSVLLVSFLIADGYSSINRINRQIMDRAPNDDKIAGRHAKNVLKAAKKEAAFYENGREAEAYYNEDWFVESVRRKLAENSKFLFYGFFQKEIPEKLKGLVEKYKGRVRLKLLNGSELPENDVHFKIADKGANLSYLSRHLNPANRVYAEIRKGDLPWIFPLFFLPAKHIVHYRKIKELAG